MRFSQFFAAILLTLPSFGHALEKAEPVSGIQSLKLVGVTDAQEVVELQQLTAGKVIDLSAYNIDQLNVLAEPQDESRVGSVHFSLEGPVQIDRWENMGDFTMEVETDNLRISQDQFPVGTYTLSVTPYEQADMEGEKGATKQISFSVIDSKTPTPSVPAILAADLVAVHESTGSFHPISRISEGGVIDSSKLSAELGNIVAISENAAKTGSVLFELDGPISMTRSTNTTVYTLADEAEHLPLSSGFPDGEYTLIITPYAEADAQGEAGVPLMLNFSVGIPQEEEVIEPAVAEEVSEMEIAPQIIGGFTAIRPSKDSQLIYVSSSTGNDSNNCFSAAAPCKSLRAALAKMRNGHPDHLYLKRGDVWRNEQLVNLHSGRGENEPAVIAYYGEAGARPKLENSRTAFYAMRENIANLHIIGLEFSAYRLDPKASEFTGSGSADIILAGKSSNILFEDNKFAHSTVILQHAENGAPSNIRLRRNIWINAAIKNGQAGKERPHTNLFMDGAVGVLVEENVFHQAVESTTSSHNVYLEAGHSYGDMIMHSNIFAGGMIHAPQAKMAGWQISNIFVETAASTNSVNGTANFIESVLDRPLGTWNDHYSKTAFNLSQEAGKSA